jgi:hypothetical protein
MDSPFAVILFAEPADCDAGQLAAENEIGMMPGAKTRRTTGSRSAEDHTDNGKVEFGYSLGHCDRQEEMARKSMV